MPMADNNTQGDLVSGWGYHPWIAWQWHRMHEAKKTVANAQLDVLARLLEARFPTGVRAFLTADYESDRTTIARVVDSGQLELISGLPEDLGPHRMEIDWMLRELTSSPTQWPDEIWGADAGNCDVYEFRLPEEGPNLVGSA